MQTEYNLLPDSLKLGELTNVDSDSNVRTFASEQEVVVGRFVVRGSSDNTCRRLNTHVASKQIGIVLDSPTRAIDANTTLDNAFEANVAVNIVDDTNGVAVEVDQNVTPADDVYARVCSTKKVMTIVFAGNLITGNSTACSINGNALSATAFNTSNAQTLTDLAAKIALEDDIASASSDGSHTITVTSKTADLSITGVTVTGGAGQTTATMATTVAGVEGDQGVLRADSDGGKAVLISGAKFLTTASSGGLVQLQYRRS